MRRLFAREPVIDAMQQRMDLGPQAMRIRRRSVEHPSGTMKAWMGHTHFQMKRLKDAKTEISLRILAYSLKRVMQILGLVPLMAAIRTSNRAHLAPCQPAASAKAASSYTGSTLC